MLRRLLPILLALYALSASASVPLDSPDTLPVLPWLSIPETSLPAVRSHLSAHQKLLIRDEISPYTNGPSLVIADADPYSEGSLFGVTGLRFAVLHFNASRTLQMVMFISEKGPLGRNIEPFLSWLRSTYGEPDVVSDDSLGDLTLLFDLDRYAIDSSMSTSGSYITTVFATAALVRQFKEWQGEDGVAARLFR